MVCTICGMESFAWLAEVFVCPVCGNFEFVSRAFLGNGQTGIEDTDQGVDLMPVVEPGSVNVEQQSRKRKISPSDDEPC